MTNHAEGTQAPAPQMHFVEQTGRPREETVALDWPFTYGERLVEKIVVRRMTTAQVDRFVEQSKTDGNAVPPMLYFVEGDPVPAELFAGMEDDDGMKLWRIIGRFLPLRLRQDAEPTPPTGGATGSPSQACSA